METIKKRRAISVKEDDTIVGVVECCDEAFVIVKHNNGKLGKICVDDIPIEFEEIN